MKKAHFYVHYGWVDCSASSPLFLFHEQGKGGIKEITKQDPCKKHNFTCTMDEQIAQHSLLFSLICHEKYHTASYDKNELAALTLCSKCTILKLMNKFTQYKKAAYDNQKRTRRRPLRTHCEIHLHGYVAEISGPFL